MLQSQLTIGERLGNLMTKIDKLNELVNKFQENISFYHAASNSYNEHSCRIEYIDPLLVILGWDVANSNGLPPQYREVIAENYSTQTDRPDYSLTLRGVTKLFVEAKKPSVDISKVVAPALQARKYGWNAKHKIVVLTNFEYLIIYDTTIIPKAEDSNAVARYREYHYSEYVEKYDEIYALISKDAVYSGDFDNYLDEWLFTSGNQKQQVDDLFLAQINDWRVSLSNELYGKDEKYRSIELLNDVVQEFINQVVFLRICEDRNLPLYHRMQDAISDPTQLHCRLEELLKAADRRYNSGLFSGRNHIFDIKSEVVIDMVKSLYYPQSPYLFSIIEPNMLGKIYEMFLTEQLILQPNGIIVLGKKKDCINRSVVTTPTEIVKYMVEKTLSLLCAGKTPKEVLSLKVADVACGSGVFLEEMFSYLQSYCIEWYLRNDSTHLIELSGGRYKLPLREKKEILCNCIFGIDIDIHAVEVAKFSLLIKLIEDETAPSVIDTTPILPDLNANIFHGNALVSNDEINEVSLSLEQLKEINPFDWNSICEDSLFDAILGNPPYVSTEGMRNLLSEAEFSIYKNKYKTSHKQFDKYFMFLERAFQKIRDCGYVCYIVPNKFFKIGAGEKLRQLIATTRSLISLDDFGDAQLFEDKTIYSSIVLLQKLQQYEFRYSYVKSVNELWMGKAATSISLSNSMINELPWRLTTDFEFLQQLKKLDAVSVPLFKHADIFNGIQTSAERPEPVYWFSLSEECGHNEKHRIFNRNGLEYHIEREILKPYFKPTKNSEKGLNSYSLLYTDKSIIFPYDADGKLYPIEYMKTHFPGAYSYLESYYDRLVPKCVLKAGIRDVPNATADTWYQYGRTQALTAFISTPKLIVGILSKEPMYAYDERDMLIASGGTAGYCAITPKKESPYAIEYIQAWLSHPYTEKILEMVGSDFEGGFIARGTFVLSKLPFVELNLEDKNHRELYSKVVVYSKTIRQINEELQTIHDKHSISVLTRKKENLIAEIQKLIAKVYRLEILKEEE